MELFIKSIYKNINLLPSMKGLTHITYQTSPVLARRVNDEAKRQGYATIETSSEIEGLNAVIIQIN